MANKTDQGVPVNVPESYPHPDGVAVQVPDAPAESTDKATTKGQTAKKKEQ